jgi:membrane protein
MKKRIQGLLSWLARVATQPLDELDRWQKAARFCYDLGRFGARQLREDRAQQMAAALAFRTLFGLLPVLVVATVLVNSLAGMDQFLVVVDELFAFAGLNDVRVVVSGNGTGEAVVESMGLDHWLKDLLGQAAAINLTAIGWVGLVVMSYAAISLMVTIENCFNNIYQASDGRAWARRIPLYWFVLTISPLAVVVSMLMNDQFATWIDSVETWQWLLYAARIGFSLGITWLFLMAIYTLFPNTQVSVHSAAIGAFVAAALFEVGKRTMGVYLANAFTISQLYGSLGLVPIFMFWVYLMWLVVLFGLEVSAILQALPGRQLEEIERKRRAHGIVDPASVVVVMEVVAERFMAGEATSVRQLSESTGIAESTVLSLIKALVAAGHVHWLASDETVSLAMPPDQIMADSLLDVGYRIVQAGDQNARSSWIERWRASQRKLAAESSLAALIAEQHPA